MHVSVQTAEEFDLELRTIKNLILEWLEVPEVRDKDPVDAVRLDVYEQLQASEFNSFTGFYWIALDSLRSALELTTIGAYYEAPIQEGTKNKLSFSAWYGGTGEVWFSEATRLLAKVPAIQEFEKQMRAIYGSGLFDKDTGWASKLHGDLSVVTHARPHASGHAHWSSNGPIYVPVAFDKCYRYFVEVMSACRVIGMLTRKPKPLYSRKSFKRLLSARSFDDIVPAKIAFQLLYNEHGG